MDSGLGRLSALLALSAGHKYCQASGMVMLKSASTACKRPQFFFIQQAQH